MTPFVLTIVNGARTHDPGPSITALFLVYTENVWIAKKTATFFMIQLKYAKSRQKRKSPFHLLQLQNPYILNNAESHYLLTN